MNPKKLATITDWPLPRTIKQVQSFLGFTNFYRKFIHHYSEIVLPLHSLTTKAIQQSFNGSNEAAMHAFETLKLAFTTAPLLQHFNPKLPSTVITDASDFTIASILLQPDKNDLLHPVAFFSCKLSIIYNDFSLPKLSINPQFPFRHSPHSTSTTLNF